MCEACELTWCCVCALGVLCADASQLGGVCRRPCRRKESERSGESGSDAKWQRSSRISHPHRWTARGAWGHTLTTTGHHCSHFSNNIILGFMGNFFSLYFFYYFFVSHINLRDVNVNGAAHHWRVSVHRSEQIMVRTDIICVLSKKYCVFFCICVFFNKPL